MNIPVMMMTAEQDPKLSSDSFAAGAVVFLPKAIYYRATADHAADADRKSEGLTCQKPARQQGLLSLRGPP